MPFVCPACARPGALRIIRGIELPPDRDSDEITLQIVKCVQCGFSAAAVYEESRRGPLDSESVRHRGYRLSAADLKALTKAMKPCRDPGNHRCTCAAHRALGSTDASGRCRALVDLRRLHLGTFEMER